MTLDEAGVRKAASMVFRNDVYLAFGEPGVACFDEFLNGIREFFVAVPPDGLSSTFVFVYPVTEEGDPLGGLVRIATALARAELAGYRRRIESAATVVVAVGPDGRYDLASPAGEPALAKWSQRSLVFVNEQGVDRFVIRGGERTMPLLATGARSNFAVATVVDLEEALERYRRDAAEVSCPMLADVWVGGRNGLRLVFRNKPEATMRRSLERFLQIRLRGDVTVRAEHNTDETRPVDVVVTWFGAQVRALVEIKWLGDSLRKDSDGRPFTSYTDSRAQDGAEQLAGYLARERSSDPGVSLRGYLAVFDGRRRRVVDPMTPIPVADACHYRDKDIVLEEKHASGETGITGIFRYFMEPRTSAYAPPKQPA